MLRQLCHRILPCSKAEGSEGEALILILVHPTPACTMTSKLLLQSANNPREQQALQGCQAWGHHSVIQQGTLVTQAVSSNIILSEQPASLRPVSMHIPVQQRP